MKAEVAECAILPAMVDDSHKKKGKDFDVVLLHSRTEDGEGVRVLRARPNQIEAGEVRPVREGRPIHHGELVNLKPRADVPNAFDVEVMHQARPSSEKEAAETQSTGRPAQVATLAYRTHWDQIFGQNNNELN